MKRLLLLPLLLLALSLAPLPVLTTGCTTTQQEATYKSLSVTWHTVDAAMLSYAQARADGKTTLSQDLAVTKLHDQYRVAMDAAISAARLDWSAPTASGLAGLAADLVTLISSYL